MIPFPMEDAIFLPIQEVVLRASDGRTILAQGTSVAPTDLLDRICDFNYLITVYFLKIVSRFIRRRTRRLTRRIASSWRAFWISARAHFQSSLSFRMMKRLVDLREYNFLRIILQWTIAVKFFYTFRMLDNSYRARKRFANLPNRFVPFFPCTSTMKVVNRL